ncbi:MAG: DUF3179 domain-containing (seleno)protein [Candidatus Promineifilaceae bacterium]|nr:DUF3179 domain-containing (seleno)protein [Candidatus Promineifilaceae bacterium]
MRERHMNWWLILVGLMVVLVACGPATDESVTTADEPPPATATAPQASPTAEPTEPAPTETVPVQDTETETDVDDSAPDDASTDDGRSELFQQITADWNTNWELHSVSYDEIQPVLPRDAIRSLDEPTFETPEEAADWLGDEDPVIAFELNGQARAYPLRILTAHEIVNDQFGDVPVVITYCPLCNSAIVFDARVDGQTLEFGTTGMLRNSDLVMYDRTTESLWQQFTGQAIVGDLTGEQLTFLPSSIVSFADFRSAFPDGQVLSRDTGFRFDYAARAYAGYDDLDNIPTLFSGDVDPRLPAMERVVSVLIDEVAMAYPLSVVAEEGVIHDTVAGQALVVFYTSGTRSNFFNPVSNEWDDVGATAVFEPELNGQSLTFVKEGKQIVDEQTGTVWNILGQGVDGPLAGETLTEIIHGNDFWFSWAAFYPDTNIYDPKTDSES